MKRTEAMKAHEDLYWLAQHHAATCHSCCHPIIDEEGNPGYFGEACAKGAAILRAYIASEKALMWRTA